MPWNRYIEMVTLYGLIAMFRITVRQFIVLSVSTWNSQQYTCFYIPAILSFSQLCNVIAAWRRLTSYTLYIDVVLYAISNARWKNYELSNSYIDMVCPHFRVQNRVYLRWLREKFWITLCEVFDWNICDQDLWSRFVTELSILLNEENKVHTVYSCVPWQ